MRKYYSEGRLLERISYVSRRESKTKNLFGEELVVHETFPFNSDSKTAPTTAKKWATQRTWNYVTKKYEDDEFVPTVVDLTNEPFDVTIIDLQVRSQGGRAYKVVDDESRVFDLREDQLLEALRLGGVQPGGRINGKFVWGVLSSQVRMVYVGGEMHKSMLDQLETNKELDLAKANGLAPKPDSLEVGHVYKKRDGSLHVFVGRVRIKDSKKKLFAFVGLPTAPYAHAKETIEGYVTQYGYKEESDFIQGLRDDAAVAAKWDTMSWKERFEWYWKKHRYSSSIMFMSTPKFDSDEGSDAQDLAELLRADSGTHRYVDGNGNDLAYARWLTKTGDDLRRHRYPDSFYYYNDAQRRAWEKQREDDKQKAHDEFRAELTWD